MCPTGALPDPATPAPPRFLPEYDNLLLSHDDRSRVFAGLGPGLPFPRGTWIGTLLVDGFFRANWSVAESDGGATLRIDRFAPRADDPAGTRDAIAEEGERLLGLSRPTRRQRGCTSTPGCVTRQAAASSPAPRAPRRRGSSATPSGTRATTVPSASMMKVERSAPQYVRPYIDFSAQTP